MNKSFFLPTTSTTQTPFHSGEIAVQKRVGIPPDSLDWARHFIRPFLSSEHVEFFRSLPFLVAAMRDSDGRMWSTLLVPDNDDDDSQFVSSPNDKTLIIEAWPVESDALSRRRRRRRRSDGGSKKEGIDLEDYGVGGDVGLLGIEFDTKRRNRVNGRIVSLKKGKRKDDNACVDDVDVPKIEVRVDQSFGNCPQYIKPRRLRKSKTKHEQQAIISKELSSQQMSQIKSRSTIFVATGYRDDNDNNNNHHHHGSDASHRGGPRGWIDIVDSKTLHLPDYSGNNMFNTLGNLERDDRMGVTVPMLETGGMIQMTGRAHVDWDDEEQAGEKYPGAKRVVVFHIEEVNQVPDGALPIRWVEDDEEEQRPMRVVEKRKESEDVTSFILKPWFGTGEGGTVQDGKLWPYRAGQHLPISIFLNEREDDQIDRTYSLSSAPNQDEYRISIKRQTYGLASRYLHDRIQVGDVIRAGRPAGDFVLDLSKSREKRWIVFVSAGIGLTPLLSMLHQFSKDEDSSRRKAFWLQGVRDGGHDPMRDEIQQVMDVVGKDRLKTHIVYSLPREQDRGLYDSEGRIDLDLVRSLVPDVHHAVFYLCGPPNFIEDLERGLVKEAGVEEKYVRSEKF